MKGKPFADEDRASQRIVAMKERRVAQPSLTTGALTGATMQMAPRIGALLLLGAGAGIGSLYVADPRMSLALIVVAAVLCLMSLMAGVVRLRHGLRRGRLMRTVSTFVENDASPSFITDAEGEIVYRNAAAGQRFEDHPADTLAFAFNDLFANPAAVLFRLQSRAQAKGAAREDIVTRRGHVRLAVHQISDAAYLWRLEDIGDRDVSGQGADALSLPMLTASAAGTVLSMNEAFRRLVGRRVKTLDRIFRDLPLKSGRVHEVDAAEGPISTLVAEVEGYGGRREIYLLPGAVIPEGPAPEWNGLEALPVPLLKIDPSGRVLASNREARALLGSEIGPDTRISDLLEGLGRSLGDWLRDAANGRGQHQTEFLRSANDDKETFVQVSLCCVTEDGGTVLVAVMNDVTELKTLEAQFVQSQKMQAIGQLAGGVAHDFNNLLTAISGYCDLLLLRHDQGDPDYSDLIQINQNSNRAASLVGQLLAFSRQQNLQPEVLDIRDTMSDLTHLLNRLVGEKVTLTLSHDPALQPIRADKRQLEQVIMNLVVNARDAMPKGGEIRLETESRTLAEPLERDRAIVPAGDYVVVTVTDEGHGIPPEKLPKIFEPFYTTKRTGEGTGLGLSTAYGIVKQTGGFIFADSVPDEGTIFTLFLPAHDAPAAPPEPVQPKIAEAMGRKADGVVLLVEDEAPVRAFASRALRLRGYTVLEADCAEAALETLKDMALEVDIFVTDVIMPGMDGPTWVREALRDRPDTKVVFVSGYAEDAFDDTKEKIPNSVFLPKPFSLADLASTVQQQLY